MRLVSLFEDEPDDPAELLKQLLDRNSLGLFDNDTITTAYEYWREDHFGDDYNAYEEMDSYISTVNDLHSKGGTIYRIVYVTDEKQIDTSNFGEYWTHNRYQIRSYIEGGTFDTNPEYRDLDPYVITARIKPQSITVPSSWASYPEEQELGITGMEAIQTYEIEPYYKPNQLSAY